jgi:hypothetical protein
MKLGIAEFLSLKALASCNTSLADGKNTQNNSI